MDPVPSSVVTAVALSAAAGKNPWVPLALIFLLAAPESVPPILMDPDLQTQLHELGPPELLWGLGALFVLVSILESLADKIPWVEAWLVPVSTSWRPFAAVAVAALVGVSASNIPVDETLATAPPLHYVGADTNLWWAGSIVVVCVLAGATFGWLATIGKTGTRLLLSMVPVPSLKLAHSFLDDLFAIVASFAGVALADSLLLAVAAVLYLAVGLVLGPMLTRLTWIHVRIGWRLFRKWIRRATRDTPTRAKTPRWLRRALERDGADPDATTILPAYTYRAPSVGRCRAGYLAFTPGTAWFATRVMFRPRLLRFDEAGLSRLGLAVSSTTRNVSVVQRAEAGLREIVFYLFPAHDDEVVPVLEQGAAAAGLARVRAHSHSARRGLPGYSELGRSRRYVPAEEAGSLRGQALATIVGAVGLGVLTGGVFVPIGTGYLLSPFKVRFVVGWALSAYLGLCVLGTFGAAWPVAVLYAVILNTLCLRDLTRAALKARIDGFVDTRAFLPPVAERVWIPEVHVDHPADRWHQGDGVPLTDGTWRAVWAVLEETPADEAPASDQPEGTPGVHVGA